MISDLSVDRVKVFNPGRFAPVIEDKNTRAADALLIFKKNPHLKNFNSLLNRTDMGPFRLLEALSVSPGLDFINKVKSLDFIVEYLERISYAELYSLRKSIKAINVWCIIISHIPVSLAYIEAKRIGVDESWIAYLTRPDVSDDDTVKIASKINKKVFLTSLEKKTISLEFLSKLAKGFIGFGGVRENITAILSEKQRTIQ